MKKKNKKKTDNSEFVKISLRKFERAVKLWRALPTHILEITVPRRRSFLTENKLLNAGIILLHVATCSYPAWHRFFSPSKEKEKKPLDGSTRYSIKHARTKAQILSADKTSWLITINETLPPDYFSFCFFVFYIEKLINIKHDILKIVLGELLWKWFVITKYSLIKLVH